MQGDPDTATESVERLADAVDVPLYCDDIDIGVGMAREIAATLRALAAERDQEAAFKAAAYESRDTARTERDAAIARAEAAEAERDGIRADQQRAVADNLTLGAQVWKRAMRHASLIAAGMGASESLVRALKDQDDVHSAPPGALDQPG